MKALITLSYLIDAEPDEIYGIGAAIEEQTREKMAEMIADRGLEPDEVDEYFAFFGVSVTVKQELEAA